MGVKRPSSACFSRAMGFQYESQFATGDAWFKEEEARPQPPLPILLSPSLAHGTSLLRLTWDSAALDLSPSVRCDPVTPHAMHTAGKVAFSPEFHQIWQCAAGVSTETQPFFGKKQPFS